MKYNTQSIEKCEYIDSMRKVYFDRPKISPNGKCFGYRNKYKHNAISHVCLECPNLISEEESENA